MNWFRFANFPEINASLLVVDDEKLFIILSDASGAIIDQTSDFGLALKNATSSAFDYFDDQSIWIAPAEKFDISLFKNEDWDNVFKVESIDVQIDDIVFQTKSDQENYRDDQIFTTDSGQGHETRTDDQNVIRNYADFNTGSSGIDGGTASTFDLLEGSNEPIESSGRVNTQSGDKYLWTYQNTETEFGLRRNQQNSPERTNYYSQIDYAESLNPKQRLAANLNAITVANNIHDDEILTDSQKEQLAKFSGWGGLLGEYSSLVSSADSDDLDRIEILKTQKDLSASFLTGYFTPKDLIEAIWKKLHQGGYQGGRVLEPSCGTGRFVTYRLKDLDDSQHFTLVEKDETTGRIAKLLNQSSKVFEMPLETFSEMNDSAGGNRFDLVIGNVPFGSHQIFDSLTGEVHSIHNYFMRRCVDLCGDEGVVAVITSTSFMDAKGSEHRKYLHERAGLIGAFRLPKGVFDGTDVSADILFFKKRKNSQPVEGEIAFIETLQSQDFSKKLRDLDRLNNVDASFDLFQREPVDKKLIGRNAYLNEAFINSSNRAVLCGEMSLNTNQWGEVVVEVKGSKEFAIEKIMKSEFHKFINFPSYNDTLLDREGSPEYKSLNFTTERPLVGGWVKNDDRIESITSYIQTPYGFEYSTRKVELSERRIKLSNGKIATAQQIAEHYLILRDLVSELNDPNNTNSDKTRVELVASYDDFYNSFGSLNHRTIAKLIADDVMSPLVFGLEIYDPKTAASVKSDLLIKDITRKTNQLIKCQNLKEATMVLFSNGKPYDDEHMNIVLGKSVQQASKEEAGVLFKDIKPDGSYEWIHAVDYLLGDVRSKLEQVNLMISEYPELDHNKFFLESHLPPWVPLSDISISMGADWIPKEVVSKFVESCFTRCNVTPPTILVTVDSETGRRKLQITNKKMNLYKQVLHIEYGTKDYSLEDIINCIFVSGSPRIMKTDDQGNTYLDREASAQALGKMEDISIEFESFIMKNSNLAKSLEETYNNTVNKFNYEIDDSYFEGYQFPDINMELRPNQRKFIVTSLMGKTEFNADCVGAGKTAMQVVIAYESKRLGLANKPAITILNHTLFQYAAECQRIYPYSKFCLVTKEDLVGERRKSFIGKIANNDWDFVVLPYTIMQSISAPLDYMLSKMEDILDGHREAFKTASTRADKRQVLRRINETEVRIDKLIDSYEKNRRFPMDKTGIDFLIYDEAHKLKNLEPVMTGNIENISISSSAIAFNEFTKANWIRETYHNGKESAVKLFTATPLSNSLSELYTWIRFCRQSIFDSLNIKSFNDFVALFANSVTSLESRPEGHGFHFKSRLCTFKNVPELLAIFRSFTQVNTREDLNLPVPSYEIEPLVVEASNWQKALMRHLVYRAKRVKNGVTSATGYKNDNMLSVTTTARQLAISSRAVTPLLPESHSKVSAVAHKALQIYRETTDVKGTILLFSDLAVPSANKNDSRYVCYYEIRDYLINNGVPSDEIGIIHEAKSDAQVKSMLDKFKSGEIRFLFGSTSKLGTGTNVQDHLVAIIDIDVPWTPKDFEQRLGRGVRYGNKNDHITIVRAITKNTADTFSYETVTRKGKMIEIGLSDPRSSDRIINEEIELSYETLVAESTGNTLIRDKAEIEGKIKKLEIRQRSHRQKHLHSVDHYEFEKFRYSKNKESLDSLLPTLTKLYQSLESIRHIYGMPFTFNEDAIKAECESTGKPLPNIAAYTRRQDYERFRDLALTILRMDGTELMCVFDRKLLTLALNDLTKDGGTLHYSINGIRCSVQIFDNTKLDKQSVIFSESLSNSVTFLLTVYSSEDNEEKVLTQRGTINSVGGLINRMIGFVRKDLPEDVNSSQKVVSELAPIIAAGMPQYTEFPQIDELKQAKEQLRIIENELSKAIALEGDYDQELILSPEGLYVAYLLEGKREDFDPLNIPESTKQRASEIVNDRIALETLLVRAGEPENISAFKQYLVDQESDTDKITTELRDHNYAIDEDDIFGEVFESSTSRPIQKQTVQAAFAN